eukprot:TRINITY_DN70160_c0_g1_i1.p1 TRINITY_DN70160_c0_g1~~TRINITY_DN70160_c0_g1_i1.p1  ORF type:complete len:255 (+),score=73.22 TRINITY_DN70160_c0_g1_i1:101-766(+)
MPRRLYAAWQAWLLRRPFLANAAQGAVMFSGGDLAAQSLLERRSDEAAPLDLSRAAHAAAVGVLYGGLLYPSFYRTLDRLLPAQSARNLALKMAADLACFGVFGNTANIYARVRLDGCGHGETVQYLRAHMPEVIMAEFAVWPAYNTLCFTRVPLHMRPTTTACMSLCWHTYMSRASHYAADEHSDTAEAAGEYSVPLFPVSALSPHPRAPAAEVRPSLLL